MYSVNDIWTGSHRLDKTHIAKDTKTDCLVSLAICVYDFIGLTGAMSKFVAPFPEEHLDNEKAVSEKRFRWYFSSLASSKLISNEKLILPAWGSIQIKKSKLVYMESGIEAEVNDKTAKEFIGICKTQKLYGF